MAIPSQHRTGSAMMFCAVPVRVLGDPNCAKLHPVRSNVTVPQAMQKHIGSLVADPQFGSPATDDAMINSSAKVVN